MSLKIHFIENICTYFILCSLSKLSKMRTPGIENSDVKALYKCDRSDVNYNRV